MKICHLTDSFPPNRGGTETHNYSLVKYLLQRGYDVDVIVGRSFNLSDECIDEAANTTNEGIKVHNMRYKKFPLWALQARNKIKEIETEGKIDIFDIHRTSDILTFLFQKRTIILSLHFFELNCPGSRSDEWILPCLSSFKKCWKCSGVFNYLKWKFVRWLAIRKVTKFMVKYEYLKSLAVENGIKEDQIEVIPHWLDIEKFRAIENNPEFKVAGVNPGDKICIHVGRLSKENGIFELLTAFGILTQKISNVKLILLGDNISAGISMKELENFCKINRIEKKVIFAGSVDREDVFKFLSLSDCAISCQLYHNYNWSLLEYMCAEKPIVATNVGGTTEILKNEYNALLSEPTPESLSSNMQQILENPQLGEKLGRNALATVREKHSFKNLNKYDSLIQRLGK